MDDQWMFNWQEVQFFSCEEEFIERAEKTPSSNCVLDSRKAVKAGIGMTPVEEAMLDSIRKMCREV